MTWNKENGLIKQRKNQGIGAEVKGGQAICKFGERVSAAFFILCKGMDRGPLRNSTGHHGIIGFQGVGRFLQLDPSVAFR